MCLALENHHRNVAKFLNSLLLYPDSQKLKVLQISSYISRQIFIIFIICHAYPSQREVRTPVSKFTN